MDNTLVLVGLMAAVWVLFIFLRAPATVLFFALLVGELVSQQLSDEAFEIINAYATLGDVRYVHVALLLLPLVASLLFLKGRVGKSKRVIEAPALLLLAAAVMIFIDHYLALSQKLPSDQLSLLRTYEGVIVSVGAAVSLVSAWLDYPRPHKDKKKH